MTQHTTICFRAYKLLGVSELYAWQAGVLQQSIPCKDDHEISTNTHDDFFNGTVFYQFIKLASIQSVFLKGMSSC